MDSANSMMWFEMSEKSMAATIFFINKPIFFWRGCNGLEGKWTGAGLEGSFADATQRHFKRSRWRRLGRQTIQDLIIATVQNIKISVRHGRNPEGTALGLLSMALLAHKGFKRALYAALVGQAAIPVKT